MAKLYDQKLIVEAIKTLPEMKSPLMDLFFPNRASHPYPYIGREVFDQMDVSVPVVGRDASALDNGGASSDTLMIVPMPIRLRDFISDSKQNDLRTRGEGALKSTFNQIVGSMRKKTKLTTEALCAQAIGSGKINYAMKIDGTDESYQITFDASYPTFTAAKKWNASGVTIAEIASDLDSMAGEIEKNGGTGSVKFAVGSDVWNAIFKAISNIPNDTRVTAKVEESVANINGYEIHRIAGSYRNGSKTEKLIPEKTIIGSCVDNNEFRYCSVDSAKAGFAGIPFWVDQYESNDPDGVKFKSECKPIPLPNIKTCIKSTVLT